MIWKLYRVTEKIGVLSKVIQLLTSRARISNTGHVALEFIITLLLYLSKTV